MIGRLVGYGSETGGGSAIETGKKDDKGGRKKEREKEAK